MRTLRISLCAAAVVALAAVGCRSTRDLDNDPAGRNPGGAPTPSYSPTDRVGDMGGENAPADRMNGTVVPDSARGLPGTSGTIGMERAPGGTTAPAAPATPSAAGAMNGSTGAAGTTAEPGAPGAARTTPTTTGTPSTTGTTDTSAAARDAGVSRTGTSRNGATGTTGATGGEPRNAGAGSSADSIDRNAQGTTPRGGANVGDGKAHPTGEPAPAPTR